MIEQVVFGCPYGSYKGDTEKELEYVKERNPNQYNFIKELFKESYEVLGIKMDDDIDCLGEPDIDIIYTSQGGDFEVELPKWMEED